jgi:hypothetical protein
VKPLVIELDDRALCLARAGAVVACAPAVMFDGGQELDAWHALRSHPTATSSRHLQSLLTQPDVSEKTIALVTADLARRLAIKQPGERLWAVTPAIADARGLGNLLAVLQELAGDVDGFFDAATATTAALGIERSAIVLELGLHHSAATFVEVSAGMSRRRRSVRTERGGLLELYQSWVEFIGAAMVKRTRFDPLHDAQTEQQLFDAVPTLLREVESGGAATAAIANGADRFEVELSRDQFALAAQPLTREILRLIHELRPAGTALTLAVPTVLSSIPGLAGEIEQFVDCELVTVPDGFAAAGVSQRDLSERVAGQPVHLSRRLALQAQLPLEPQARRRLGGRRIGGPAPTHILFEGRAIAIGSDARVMGRAPGNPRSVTLPDGVAGVSRRHCTFLRDGEDLVLLDHSSFGTFVNDERVAERVRVYAGDRVRLGEPGIEMSLISVGEHG